MMAPATTDARGGGTFAGHGGAIGGSFARFGAAGAFQNTAPAIAGPATARRFPFSSRHFFSPNAAASNVRLARRFALHHRRAIASHFATLGSDGIWLDNYVVYAPTLLIAQQPVVAQQQPTHSRAPSVKTPSAARQGIVLVRGDSKTYVTFPSPKRG